MFTGMRRPMPCTCGVSGTMRHFVVAGWRKVIFAGEGNRHANGRSPSVPGSASGLGLVLLYFVLQLVLGTGLVLLLMLVVRLTGAEGPAAPDDIAGLLAMPDVKAGLVSSTLLLATLVVFWVVRRLWGAWWRVSDPPGFGWVGAPWRWYAYALVAGVLMALLGGVLTQWLAHGRTLSQDVSVMGGQASPAIRVLLAVLMVCVAPLVEELIFRGVLLSGLMQRMQAGWAILVSALVFGLMHLADFGFVWYAIPALAGLGVVLAWLRLRSGSLWPAVVAHATNNALAVLGWFVIGMPH